MAEFLLFHRTEDCIRRGVSAHHYMDEWSPEKVASLNEKELRKYNARNIVGDIVQIEEDGFWTAQRTGWGYPVFYLLCLPFITKTQALTFIGPNRDVNDVLLKKCRYGVDVMLSLPFVDGKLTITRRQDARNMLKDYSTSTYVTF